MAASNQFYKSNAIDSMFITKSTLYLIDQISLFCSEFIHKIILQIVDRDATNQTDEIGFLRLLHIL